MSDESIYRLSLGTLRCVREVLANGNVTIAAGRLGISQPAVSQHIARFEKLSGITVMARNGNALVMRSEMISPLLDTLSDLERLLLTIARTDAAPRPRLGICQFAIANHCDGRLFHALLAEFDIYVGCFQTLSDRYSRGELDAVARPLASAELETDLTTRIALKWVTANANTATQQATLRRQPPVIMYTDPSPYNLPAERALKGAGIAYRLVARVDDQHALFRLVRDESAFALVPEPLVRRHPGEMAVVDWLPPPGEIPIGLYHNSKIIPATKARKLFSRLFAGAN